MKYTHCFLFDDDPRNYSVSWSLQFLTEMLGQGIKYGTLLKSKWNSLTWVIEIYISKYELQSKKNFRLNDHEISWN